MVRVMTALGVLLGLGGGPAMAFCSEPSDSFTAPDAPGSFDKPDLPYCLTGFKWSKRHTCSDWEIDHFKEELEDYLEKLNAYSEEASELARKANRFAQDAYDYAKCEAEEVTSEIK